MSNQIELLQQKLPTFYKKYEYKSENEKSVLYGFLTAFADIISDSNSILDRIDAMLGIGTTYDEDLMHRWGSLFGISKGDGSWALFRNKLKLAILSRYGGTAQAIKFAVAVIGNIENETELQDKYIEVIDAWEYDKEILRHDYDPMYNEITNMEEFTLNNGFVLNKSYDPHKYGAFVVTVDLAANETILSPDNKDIYEAITTVKACGTNVYLIFIYSTEEFATIHMDEYYEEHITDVLLNALTEHARLIAWNLPYYPSLNDDVVPHVLNSTFILNERVPEYDYQVENIFDHITYSNEDSGSVGNGIDDYFDGIVDKSYDAYNVDSTDDYDKISAIEHNNEVCGIEYSKADNLCDQVKCAIEDNVTFMFTSDAGCTNSSATLNDTFILNSIFEADMNVDIITYI